MIENPNRNFPKFLTNCTVSRSNRQLFRLIIKAVLCSEVKRIFDVEMPMHFSLQMTAVNMTVSMLQLLLLTAVTQASGALTDSTLTTDQLHTDLCVWSVAHRHFAPARPLGVSMPRTTPDVARRPLSDPLPQRDDLQTVSVLLGKLHEGTRWPIELFRPSRDDTADTLVSQHSYILFVWNEGASN